MAFDKKRFSILLTKAKGDRSINGFGNQAKVDPGYISRLLREKVETPPGPGVIKKLADSAFPGVSYEELMAAAGYLQEPAGEGVYHMKSMLEQSVAEALQKPLADFLPVKSIPLVNASDFDFRKQISGNMLNYINVPRELDADFAFTVQDNAMIDVGIYPGDVAVCRKAGQVPPGEMIIARLEGRNTGIRYLLCEGDNLTLKAANSIVPKQKTSRPDVLGVVLMIQKKALRYEQYMALRKRDCEDEIISEGFLLEKLAESSGLPLAKIKVAFNTLKKKKS